MIFSILAQWLGLETGFLSKVSTLILKIIRETRFLGLFASLIPR